MYKDFDVVQLAKDSEQSGRSSVANMTLASLRSLRDNCPKQWDELMAADNDGVICVLWDYLVEQTKEV